MLGAKNLYRMMTHLPDKGRIGRSSLLPELVKMDVIGVLASPGASLVRL